MTVQLIPSHLTGSLSVPASKSTLHRALICAALAAGTSRITKVTFSQDVDATIRCLEKLGARVARREDALELTGLQPKQIGSPETACVRLNCGESGSTLRFLMPVAAALGRSCILEGRGRLAQRPLGPYLSLLPAFGVSCRMLEAGSTLPLQCDGRLAPGVFCLPGNISSQFVSGLLFALPLLPGDSRLEITSRLESADYVTLTLEALKRAGIQVFWEKQPDGSGAFVIPGGQRYQAFSYEAEGDYSQAAFWLTANALGANLEVLGLLPDSRQGDSAICSILEAGGPLFLDVSDIPDLVPVLAVYASVQEGRSVLYNASRLRLKESDRLVTTRTALQAIGACIREEGDSLVIEGKTELDGGKASAFRDHRIAMALAVASTRCRNPVVIEGAECVAKSYPDFWLDFRRCGGKWEDIA